MRQIEVAMAAAIRDQRPWRRSNTEVRVIVGNSVYGYPLIQVYLFGNCVADLYRDRYIFRDCGWPTVTTRSRLNAVFWAVNLRWLMYQRNWQQYLSGPEFGGEVPFFGEYTHELSTLSAADWCRENGYTEPFFQEGRWWGYPINGVIPIPIAYYGRA